MYTQDNDAGPNRLVSLFMSLLFFPAITYAL